MAARQDEFERIAMPHVSSLLGVARRLSRDTATAEDMVQETMLHAWRAFHQFQRGSNARAWLFRILFHNYYSHGRKQRAAPALVPLSSHNEEASPRMESSGVEPADVAGALAALTPEHRAVVLLGIVEGFTCEEIAGVLSAPIGTIMSRLSRARQALRERLRPGASCAKRGAI
jgi:RNA polymerase sigma-70 factor, ECF subfamily